jgi:hypothetical protein
MAVAIYPIQTIFTIPTLTARRRLMIRHLQAVHEALTRDYQQIFSKYISLQHEHSSFRRKVIGSHYKSSDAGDKEAENEAINHPGGNGMLMMDPAAPNFIATKLTLPQGSCLCLSPQGADRSGEFDASKASGDAVHQKWDWSTSTLVSTQDNHTEAEIKL